MKDLDKEWKGPRCKECGRRMNVYGRVCATCEVEAFLAAREDDA